MKHFSLLDFFVLSSTLFDKAVDRVRVVHDADNLSDHDPVFLTLHINSPTVLLSDQVHSPRPSWCKAGAAALELYRTVLADNLATIALPVEAISCHDVLCKDASHAASINRYAAQIIGACNTATNIAIPMTCIRDPKRVPGWTEYVEPVRQKSLFWHRLWCDCGRPRSGVVADVMRRTRATYHRTMRRVKRNEQVIVRQRFADASLRSGERDFWAEVRKLTGHHGHLAQIVDDSCNSQDIALLFAQKYRDLYSSVSYTVNDMNAINSALTSRIICDGYNDACTVLSCEVADAVNRLKPNKRDGYSGLTTDNFKFACYDLFVHTARLLSGVIVHGSVPDDLLIGTTIPIPKSKHSNVTSSDNYRGITLSSIHGPDS
jgi:hypothetical protein